MRKNISFVLFLVLVYVGNVFAKDLSPETEKWINERLWQPLTEQRKAGVNKVLNNPREQKLEFLRKRIEFFCETSPGWLERAKGNLDDADRKIPRGSFMAMGPLKKMEAFCDNFRGANVWGASRSYEDYLANSKSFLDKRTEKIPALMDEMFLTWAFAMPTQISEIKQDQLTNIDDAVRAKFVPAKELNFDNIGDKLLKAGPNKPAGVAFSLQELEAVLAKPQRFQSDGQGFTLQLFAEDKSGLNQLLMKGRTAEHFIIPLTMKYRASQEIQGTLHSTSKNPGGWNWQTKNDATTTWYLVNPAHGNQVHVRVVIQKE